MTNKEYNEFLKSITVTKEDLQHCAEFVLEGHDLDGELTVDVEDSIIIDGDTKLATITLIDNTNPDCCEVMQISYQLCKYMIGVAGYQLHEYMDIGILYPMLVSIQGKRYRKGYIGLSESAIK